MTRPLLLRGAAACGMGGADKRRAKARRMRPVIGAWGRPFAFDEAAQTGARFGAIPRAVWHGKVRLARARIIEEGERRRKAAGPSGWLRADRFYRPRNAPLPASRFRTARILGLKTPQRMASCGSPRGGCPRAAGRAYALARGVDGAPQGGARFEPMALARSCEARRRRCCALRRSISPRLLSSGEAACTTHARWRGERIVCA